MTGAIPILLYHSVGNAGTPAYRRWIVDPSVFERHMACIRAEGCTAVTVSELVNRMRDGLLPTRTVAVTFDDGLRDFATNALPILRQYELPATLYVCTGYVGATSRWLRALGEGERSMLTWTDLQDLRQEGVEIGAHTRCHPQLDLLPSGHAREEIEGSRHDLEDRLGMVVRSFAYPHGYHSPRVRALVIAAGYESACAVKHRLSVPTDDRFALARIIVDPRVTMATFRQWLRGEALPVVAPGRRLATVGWRTARRVRVRWRAGRQ